MCVPQAIGVGSGLLTGASVVRSFTPPNLQSPRPPAGAPPATQETATRLARPSGQTARRRAAARAGTGSLRIPINTVNLPR